LALAAALHQTLASAGAGENSEKKEQIRKNGWITFSVHCSQQTTSTSKPFEAPSFTWPGSLESS